VLQGGERKPVFCLATADNRFFLSLAVCGFSPDERIFNGIKTTGCNSFDLCAEHWHVTCLMEVQTL
jgi:hypothetical protein